MAPYFYGINPINQALKHGAIVHLNQMKIMTNQFWTELSDRQAEKMAGGASLSLTAEADGETTSTGTPIIVNKDLPNGGYLLVGRAFAVATGDPRFTSVDISASGDIAKTVAKSTSPNAAISRSMGVGIAIDLPNR